MNKEIQINSTRRKLLQSAASGAALATTGWVSVALADEVASGAGQATTTALPTCDLTIYQLQTSTSDKVTVMNQTELPVTIDAVYPVGLSHPSGSLAVKVKVPNGPVTLEPGARLSFDIEAHTNNTRWGLNDEIGPNVVAGRAKAIPNVISGKIEVQSVHPDFNGIIPVTVFDAVPA